MNILAVGAHHDDIELGCGGTLARLALEGHNVYGLILTNSETHYDIRGIHRTAETAQEEAQKAAAVIGIQPLEIDGAGVDNGTLTYNVQLMRRIEDVIADKAITFVFSHWTADLNTDHEAAAKMTVVAARRVPSILMYRSNWYQPSRPFNGIFSVDISEVIAQKKKSLACYRSEIKNRGRAWIDSFIDANRTAGLAIEKQYAEVFEPIKYELFQG